MTPGLMLTTSTPWGASTRARVADHVTIASFDCAYACTGEYPVARSRSCTASPAMRWVVELTVTTRPPRRRCGARRSVRSTIAR